MATKIAKQQTINPSLYRKNSYNAASTKKVVKRGVQKAYISLTTFK